MMLKTRLIIALCICAVGAAGQMVLGRQIESMRAGQSGSLDVALAQFPDRIGSWVGAELAANPQVIADIKIDDYLQRVYVHPTGERVVLWMSYSSRSSDQYHYPTVCMEGKGWQEDEAARAVFAPGSESSDDGRRARAMRMCFTKNRQSQVVYYWYYLIGEDPVDRAMRKLGRTARAFLRGRRNASLTVEVFSQSPRPNRQVLDEFVGEVTKRLDGWMPPGTIVACDLGANY